MAIPPNPVMIVQSVASSHDRPVCCRKKAVGTAPVPTDVN